MYTGLLILLVLDCVALMIVVLLQAGKGGGLAAGFGGAGTGIEMMGSRQTATFLHNATKWLGGAFLVICFVISLLTVRGSAPRGLIESQLQDQPAPAAQPAAGSPSDLEGALGGEQTPAGQPPAEQGQPSETPQRP